MDKHLGGYLGVGFILQNSAHGWSLTRKDALFGSGGLFNHLQHPITF